MSNQKITDAEIIKALKAIRAHFKRPISSTDARKYRRNHPDTMPSVATIIERFSTWNAALKAAGLETCAPGNAYKIAEIEERKKAAIELLKAFYEEKGRAPLVVDFIHAKLHGLSYRTISDLFGGWPNALEAAGLENVRKTNSAVPNMHPTLAINVDMSDWEIKKIKSFFGIVSQSGLELSSR